MNKPPELSEKWIKASIIGTLWAASEIVLGSFLHNLRVPFSSNVLTAIGIIILVSSSYRWRESGLFWRAGLICALMKTMSPSAVVFGPMIAIFSQAALLEMSVFLFRRNALGYLIGGMLAMSWNVVQRVLNYLIFYGYSIVEVYADLIKVANKQWGLSIGFWSPVWALVAIHVILGGVAGGIGMSVGVRLRKGSGKSVAIQKERHFLKTSPKTAEMKYSIFWLFFNLALMVACFLILNFCSWMVWIPAVMAVALTWVLRYKRALRQLSRPRFWLYFAAITMLAAFVISTVESQPWMDGLMIGIQMNFRAAVVILGFTVLGTELYNPRVRHFFSRTAFRSLPPALELSFQSLPAMVAYVPDLKTFLRRPGRVVFNIMSMIEERLQEITSQPSRTIIILSGKIGQGKTTLASEIVNLLKREGRSVGGTLCPRILEQGETIGYDIVDIISNKQEIFLRKGHEEVNDRIGYYAIFQKGLQTGKEALENALAAKCDWIIVDETGKMELEGKGWADLIDRLASVPSVNLLLTVRDSFVEEVIAKWGWKDPMIFNLAKDDKGEVLRQVG